MPWLCANPTCDCTMPWRLAPCAAPSACMQALGKRCAAKSLVCVGTRATESVVCTVLSRAFLIPIEFSSLHRFRIVCPVLSMTGHCASHLPYEIRRSLDLAPYPRVHSRHHGGAHA